MALADDFPAFAALLAVDPNYTALGVTAVRALAADTKKALAVVQRFQDTQPFGPGYQAGYRRAVEDHHPDLLRCLSNNADLGQTGGNLVRLLGGFDWDNYTGADVMALLAAGEALAAKLPADRAEAGTAATASGASGTLT